MNKNQEQKPKNFKDLGSTTLFRITNFELFVKNNKYVMAFGLCSITFCSCYLFYMNLKYDEWLQQQNTIVNQDLITKKPKSRWD